MTVNEFILHAINFIESSEENMRNYTACFDYIEYHLMNIEHETEETTRWILRAIQEMFYGRHPEIHHAEQQAMVRAAMTLCLN